MNMNGNMPNSPTSPVTQTLHSICPDMDTIIADIAKETVMKKIKNSSKVYERTFFVDREQMLLCYWGSTKVLKPNPVKLKLSTLHDIRDGNKEFTKRLQNIDKSCVICFVFGVKNHKVLYLSAPSEKVKENWIQGITYLLQKHSFAAFQRLQDRWIKEAFRLADKNKDGLVDLSECYSLVKKMNTEADKSYIRKLFHEVNVTKHKGRKQFLDEEEFVQFYLKLTKRDELKEIFKSFCSNPDFMTSSDLYLFLKNYQRIENVTTAQCLHYIDIFEPSEDDKRASRLTLYGFRNLLRCPQLLLFNHSHTKIYQDMEKPLHYYYINSSHNTYLMADQLKGTSSTEGYIRALKRGCRCVELDCWDGPAGEPVIYHGHTLTSKISFEDVINVINEYGFQASSFPLILSLENHCSIQQQTRMAEIMKTVFGDKIFTARESDLQSLPSPDSLKNRIVIKCKKLPIDTFSSPMVEGDVTDEDEAAEMSPEVCKDIKKLAKKHKLSIDLSNLVSITRSVGFKGFDKAINNDHFTNISSLNEAKCEKLIKEHSSKFVKHTYNFMVRTYPGGSRTDSSNYNPLPMWSVGCQIVALNFQTTDDAMLLNHGKFLHNGGCGYVLKPGILISGGDEYFNPQGPFDPAWTRTLEIKIISAYQLPKPNNQVKGEIIDPFVCLEVHGVPADTQQVQTKYVSNNGLNPVFNTTFVLPVKVPQLAMLKFTVLDHDEYSADDFIGFFSIPFVSLQQGYRQFHLYSKHCDINLQTLVLTHVTIHKGHYSPPGYVTVKSRSALCSCR